MTQTQTKYWIVMEQPDEGAGKISAQTSILIHATREEAEKRAHKAARIIGVNHVVLEIVSCFGAPLAINEIPVI